jgi:ribose transport system substrate-binding protein
VLHTDAAPGFSNLVRNQVAFRERIESEYPDIELLPLQWDDGDVATNASIMRATLASHPDLAGAYLGTSGLGGRGGVTALEEAGLDGQVKVVTLDGLPGAIEDLRNGSQHAVTSVQLFDLGWLAVEAAVAALNGDEVPAVIDSGYCVLTAENIDDPEIAETYCLYPSES